MPRLLHTSLPTALALVVVVAVLATASAASTSPAHSNAAKGKGKGKPSSCPSAEQCKIGTQADIDAIWSYLGTKSAWVEARATMDGSSACAVVLKPGFDTECSQSTTLTPRTIVSTTQCAPGYQVVVQTDCWGWIVAEVDGNEVDVGPLPVYDSGAIGNTAYCRLGTEGLADGTVVQIYQTLTCSSFVGTVASASAPRISAADQDRLAKAKGV